MDQLTDIYHLKVGFVLVINIKRKIMYKIKEESIQIFTQAFNLLDEIEIKGIKNINALGNSVALFRQFFESIERIEDELNTNTKEDKK
jgi:hypothetical protein